MVSLTSMDLRDIVAAQIFGSYAMWYDRLGHHLTIC
jgi:hypothetical protein